MASEHKSENASIKRFASKLDQKRCDTILQCIQIVSDKSKQNYLSQLEIPLTIMTMIAEYATGSIFVCSSKVKRNLNLTKKKKCGNEVLILNEHKIDSSLKYTNNLSKSKEMYNINVSNYFVDEFDQSVYFVTRIAPKLKINSKPNHSKNSSNNNRNNNNNNNNNNEATYDIKKSTIKSVQCSECVNIDLSKECVCGFRNVKRDVVNGWKDCSMCHKGVCTRWGRGFDDTSYCKLRKCNDCKKSGCSVCVPAYEITGVKKRRPPIYKAKYRCISCSLSNT